MKNQITLLATIILLCTTQLFAQTNTFPATGSAGVGTTTPNASSILEVNSTTQGMLAPRMTKTQRDAIATPATGLLIYQTNSTPGFYYFNGTAWTAVSTKGANLNLSNLSATGTAINQSLNPGTTGTLDLGSSTNRWDEGYINTLRFSDGTSMTTATGAGGGISGSGTSNYITKFTGASSVGSSTIYDNSGNVGINTTSMIGSANFVVKSGFVTGYGGMYLDMGGTSGRKPFYGYAIGGVSKAWTYYDEATSQFRINNGGDRLVIDNTGKIGIGTTSPSYNFEIQTSGTSTISRISKPWTGTGTTNFNLVEISNAYNFGYGTGLISSGGQIGVKGTASNGAQTGYGVYGSGFGAAGDTYGVYGTAGTTAGTSYGVYGTTTGGPTQWAGYFDGKVHIGNGVDASLSGHGFLTMGDLSSTNVVIDNNEIMARNNGANSPLYLNDDGGDVIMCYGSGNVRIGAAATSATGYLLAVDGKVICEE
ncbi:MAG: hypothetical protein H7Y00_07085, partial [Fimbriimonadaceae bacterium]|nr:hypothetical protein [Chitinophagales bacterium]